MAVIAQDAAKQLTVQKAHYSHPKARISRRLLQQVYYRFTIIIIHKTVGQGCRLYLLNKSLITRKLLGSLPTAACHRDEGTVRMKSSEAERKSAA